MFGITIMKTKNVTDLKNTVYTQSQMFDKAVELLRPPEMNHQDVVDFLHTAVSTNNPVLKETLLNEIKGKNGGGVVGFGRNENANG